MPSTISAGTTAGTAIAIAGDTTGNLAFQTNGTTTAMTINTSQNVQLNAAGARILNSSGNPILLQTGSVLQVVRTNITTQASYGLNNAAIQATALSASITPTSASSHIIVQMTASIQANSTGQGLYGEIRRNGSTILNPTAGGGSNNYPIHWINTRSQPNMGNQLATQTWVGFDSPATTSSTSYTFWVYGVPGTGAMDLNTQGDGRGSSVIVLWEIAG